MSRSTPGITSRDLDGERKLRNELKSLPMGEIRYFHQVGSTNDVGMTWLGEGAQDNSLVVAHNQTSGRGRGNHVWHSLPSASLTFSILFRPPHKRQLNIALFSWLGAYSVVKVLEGLGLTPLIKWPNDVILNGKKVCGILAESFWMGERLSGIVLGIGVNLTASSVPPAETINFPATCLEVEVSQKIEANEILRNILVEVMNLKLILESKRFIAQCDQHLAFRGAKVEIFNGDQVISKGTIIGLDKNGSLVLSNPDGKTFPVQMGEMHLREVV